MNKRDSGFNSRSLMASRFWNRSPINPLALLVSGLLILNASFLWTQFDLVRGQDQILTRSSQVLLELESLFSSVSAAESGVRGFFITKDPEFMEPYLKGRGMINAHLQALRELTISNDRQHAALTGIEKSIEVRVRGLEDVVRDTTRINSNIDLVSSGRILMDSLRAQIEFVKSEEQKNLTAQLAAVQRAHRNFKIGLVLATALVLIGSIWALQKVWKHHRQTQQEVLNKNHQNWLTGHVSELSQALSGNLNQAEVALTALKKISASCIAPAAHFYAAENGELHCVGSLASASPEKVEGGFHSRWKIGEGLVGEAFLKEGLSEIDHVPESYFQIASGLGKARPRVLTFLPIRHNETRMGVVEIASFKSLEEPEKELLRSFAPILGLSINSAQWRERLQKLLEQTQQQTEELQAQQEELRTSNEELEAQARTLELHQETLNKRNDELALAKQQAENKTVELLRANQYKTEFLAKMSHELRTPLNSLLILSTLLIENKEQNLTERQKEFARSIYSSGHDLLGLINDILDLSKIEAQKLVMRAEEFTIKSLVEHLSKTFGIQFQNKGVEFLVDVPVDVSNIRMVTDRQRIEQVLRNFLSNALKFTENGSVALSIRSVQDASGQGDSWVRFSVRDTGIGIPADKKNLIFEAFEQADSSISRRFGGTGLGLTISQELSHMLGGSISLDSEEGKGSAFHLTIPKRLPLKQGATSQEKEIEISESRLPENETQRQRISLEAQQAVEKAAPQTRSILIIEDDASFRETIAQIAKESHFATLEVGTAEAGLQILKEYVPSAILLDLKLPGMSGLAFLSEIKQNPALRGVPVHVISSQDYQSNVMKMGAASFIEKPVRLEGVQSALKRIEELLLQKVKKILVVEDNERQLRAISELVSGEDIELKTVRGGKLALEVMKKEKFDCVILDLELPDITGFEILDELSASNLSLPPVIIYTGRDVTPKEEEHLRKYSESIIIKGARSPERLLDEVNLFLHRVQSVPPTELLSPSPMPAVDSTFANRTALLVDDDLRNVFALTSVLESWGFNVRIARDGLEALSTLEENPQVDVVLMDLMMPKMDGLEATRRIRKIKQFEALPIVALTAKSAKDTHERCLEAGANDYLPKPIQIGNLRSVLKVWLMPKGVFS